MVGVPRLFQSGHQRGLEIWEISGGGSVRSRDVSLLSASGHQRGLEIWAISGGGSVRSRDAALLSSEVGAAKIGNDHGASDDDCYGIS